MSDGLNAVNEYVQQKTTELTKDNASIDTLSKQSPASKISSTINQSASDSVFSDVAASPLVQLGKDFVSEQVAKNGAALINNADTALLSIRTPVEQAYNVVFDTISSALVAKNDMIMYFLQQVAQNAITAIEQKRATLLVMEEKLRLLYNALVTLVAGQPFFSKYVLQLRQALTLIVQAKGQVALVRDTLQSTNNWLPIQFNSARSNLVAAEALMQPSGPPPDQKITSKGFLSSVGIPSTPQQLTVLLAVPQLVKELVSASTNYFTQTLKVNVLLTAFLAGFVNLQKSGSQRLQSYSVSTLTNLLGQLDSLITSMSGRLNGDPAALTPIPGFQPDSVKTSAAALQWLMQVKAIIAFMDFVPGKALNTITVSNTILDQYNKAAAGIKTKNLRTNGAATLHATQGSEDFSDLESQVTTFTLAALQAIVSGSVASNILSLGRTLQNRMDLSIAQDQEIEVLLQAFVATKANLPTGIAAIGAGVFTLLDSFGMDRASSLLNTGNFTDFFNLNVKTVTFVGAGLLGISALKECLDTEEDRAQLSSAQVTLQGEQKAKELLAQRSASTGLQQQKAANQTQITQLNAMLNQASRANAKCNPSDTLASNLLNKLSAVVGSPIPTNMGTGITG